MKSLFAVVLLSMFCAASLPVKAQETPMEQVIASQLDAFRADDFVTAFSFASPMIQNLFGSPANFGVMVKRGYPMVWRPSDVRYLGAQMRGGALWQDVMIRDLEGRVHIVEYEMIEGENGWKINGVRLRAPGAGTA